MPTKEDVHASKDKCTEHLLLATDCLSTIEERLLLIVEWLLGTREHLLLATNCLSAIGEFAALSGDLRSLPQIEAQTRRTLAELG